MLQSFIASGLALTLVLTTACTIKGKGSARERYETAQGAEASGETGDLQPAETPACLKLAAKRKNNLKLLQEGEEPEAETGEEVAACPEEEPSSEEETPPEETESEEVPPEE